MADPKGGMRAKLLVANKVRDGISNTRMTSGAVEGMDVRVKEMSILDWTLAFQQIKARVVFWGTHEQLR